MPYVGGQACAPISPQRSSSKHPVVGGRGKAGVCGIGLRKKKRCPLRSEGKPSHPSKRRPIAMKYNVVVATHHKTGTVWMDGVFKAIAHDLGAEYVDFRSQSGQFPDALRKPFILLNYDSDFREHADILERDDVRILHLVRDPRDVLISAMHYHKKSNESWLHEPIPGYNDVTYQRRLRAQP